MNEQVEKKNVLWMIIFRLLVVTLLFAVAVIIQYSASTAFPMIPFLYAVIASYGLSGVYFALYQWGKRLDFQAYAQIVVDLFMITGFVYITGGLSSSAYFLYVFPIIGAGLVLWGRATYLVASLSSIFFGVLADGLYLGFIPHYAPDQEIALPFGSVLYTVFIAWSAFFIIAFLINRLAAILRKARRDLRDAQRELLVRERLSEAGRISATMAHEIRNPLAAISGSVQVLKKELALNREQRELMDIVLKESQRVSHSLEEFLDFALPPKQVFSVICLPDILDETIKMLRGGGELNGQIRLGGNFASSGLHYFGSAGQFKQVFWNLIKNAIKAMPGGGSLDIDFLTTGDGIIQLRFADSGIGMNDEDKDHLFEPFYSRFEGGRGLGLSIVRRIVDDYDGRIEFTSEPDKGTEVVITLPVREQPK